MDINRRRFIGQVAYVGAGVSVAGLAGCNSGGGSDGAAGLPDASPELPSFSAAGTWHYDDSARELSLVITESDFSAECEPRPDSSQAYTVRAVLSDAMYWLVEDSAGNARLLQWLRAPSPASGIEGHWLNAAGYRLTLAQGGTLNLEFSGLKCDGQGFAGANLLALSPFQQGVASGDPQRNSLVLWTRDASMQGTALRWQVATDPLFNNPVQSGEVVAGAANDYTVKIVATGLEPGRRYYYRFDTPQHTDPAGTPYRSMAGRAQTLPAGSPDSLRFAVVSCSSYPHGFFNGYRQAARHDDLDYVLHLGDYIYEYPGLDPDGSNDYADPEAIAQGRVYRSDNQVEPTILDDYRKRHRRYKEDPDLQLLHSRYAFITTWDDHETTDNSFDPDGSGPGGGAVNHQSTEGAWEDRKAAGVQAYNEWMPITAIDDVNDPQIHRHFAFGDLAELMILDTRIEGRHRQPNIFFDTYNDPARRLISEAQEAWLKDRLSKAQQAGRTWKIIGQQVMMGHLQGPPLLGAEQPEEAPSEPVSPEWANVLNPDQWDGYNANRQRIWEHIKGGAEGIDVAIDNVVVLTGDIHTSWAMEHVDDPARVNAEPLIPVQKYGVEFVTPSITSPGLPDPEGSLTTAVRTYNPHIKYSNLDRRGYMLLELTPDEAVAIWYHLESILERENNNQELAARFAVAVGSRDLSSQGG